MNIKDCMIMDEYKKQKDSFVQMGEVVHQMLREIVDEAGILLRELNIVSKEKKVLRENCIKTETITRNWRI